MAQHVEVPLRRYPWDTLTIASGGGAGSVDGATVVKTDIGVRNGVIHVIDSVILAEDE
jgi:uncharacterized surface protein with fasciclin (FAS1) repeats